MGTRGIRCHSTVSDVRNGESLQAVQDLTLIFRSALQAAEVADVTQQMLEKIHSGQVHILSMASNKLEHVAYISSFRKTAL